LFLSTITVCGVIPSWRGALSGSLGCRIPAFR
jgi:hypothetical protein